MNTIFIKIKGYPRPQPRGRIAGRKVKLAGGGMALVDPRIVSIVDIKAQSWAEASRYAAQQAVKDFGGLPTAEQVIGGRTDPLAMKCVFYMPTKHKADHGKWHSNASGHDLDNLEKLIMDALMGKKGAPLGSNDSRICHKEGVKVWAPYQDSGCIVLLKRCAPVEAVIRKMMDEFLKE